MLRSNLHGILRHLVLVPGQILYLFFEFLNPEKSKYSVLVCDCDKPFLFFANTNVAPFIRRNPDMLAAQVRITPAEYPFLDHDSYINCSEVICYLLRKDIEDQDTNGSVIRGRLSQATRSRVVEVVEGCRTLTPRQKTAIVEYLR